MSYSDHTMKGKASTHVTRLSQISVPSAAGGAQHPETGKGVVVGHPDTGIRSAMYPYIPPNSSTAPERRRLRPHPVLVNRLEQGWGLVGYNPLVGSLEFNADHGTHTGSIICGEAWLNPPYPLPNDHEAKILQSWRGVAPGARLLPVDVGGLVLTDPVDLTFAILYCVARGADVISMSLAQPGFAMLKRSATGLTQKMRRLLWGDFADPILDFTDQLEQRLDDPIPDNLGVLSALEAAEALGVIVCAATGQIVSDSLLPVAFPASHSTVIACCGWDPATRQRWTPCFWKGKVYKTDSLSHQSKGAGEPVQVAAPAADVTLATWANRFNSIVDDNTPTAMVSEGTSYATAFTAGVAAMWCEKYSGLCSKLGLNRARTFRYVLHECGMHEILNCGYQLDAAKILAYDVSKIPTNIQDKLK